MYTEWAPADDQNGSTFSVEDLRALDAAERQRMRGTGLAVRVCAQSDRFLRLLAGTGWSYWDYFYQGLMTVRQGGDQFLVSFGAGRRGNYDVRTVRNAYQFEDWSDKTIVEVPMDLAASRTEDLIREVEAALASVLDLQLTDDRMENFNLLHEQGRSRLGRS
ncbi:hypothetical protein ACLBXM_09960 [Xanthobacteraceae bacterium A53D]